MTKLSTIVYGLAASILITETSALESCVTNGMTISVTSSSQNLPAPQFQPNSSSNLFYCTWILKTTSPNYIVELQVMNSEMERSSLCTHDYLIAYDGPSPQSHVLKKWCGPEQPTLYSSGQYLTISFYVDKKFTQEGIQLVHHQVAKADLFGVQCYHPSSPSKDITAENSTKEITSPNYPNSYASNSDCVWTFKAADQGYVVEIIVLDTQLEASVKCQFDRITVYDSNTIHGDVLGKWCGDNSQSFQSSGQYMTIHFQSDSTREGSGFRIAYHQIIASERSRSGLRMEIIIPGIIVGVIFVLVLGHVIKKCSRSSHQSVSSEDSCTSSAHINQMSSTAAFFPTSMSSITSLRSTSLARHPPYQDHIYQCALDYLHHSSCRMPPPYSVQTVYPEQYAYPLQHGYSEQSLAVRHSLYEQHLDALLKSACPQNGTSSPPTPLVHYPNEPPPPYSTEEYVPALSQPLLSPDDQDQDSDSEMYPLHEIKTVENDTKL